MRTMWRTVTIASVASATWVTTAAPAAHGDEQQVRRNAMAVAPWKGEQWAGVDVRGAEYRRMAEAARALTEARDGLARLLDRRRSEFGSAGAANIEILLDLSDALVTYDNVQVRPKAGVAPQFNDLAGQSLDRIRGTPVFQPCNEDVQVLFRGNGKEWARPKLGMLTSKFLAGFHFKGCEGVSFEWSDSTLSGRFMLAAARGDRRYLMHHSGEGSTTVIPEFTQWKDYSSGYWPDWWGGPRERALAWKETFSIAANERRGWLLKATLRSDERPSGFQTPDKDLFAWIENGRVLRGYAIVPGKLPGRGPEVLVSLDRWSLKGRTLEADFKLGSDATATNRFRSRERWALNASLPDADCGVFVGTYRAVLERPKAGNSNEVADETVTGALDGTLYRAYRGTYSTEGTDGRRTGETLAGVAVAPAAARVVLPDLPTADGTQSAVLFTNAIALSRQAAALDWALREYPLSIEDALRFVGEGRDDRFTYYPRDVAWVIKSTKKSGFNRNVPANVRPHMHEAMAAMMGTDAAGAAAYVERLAEVARAALADRKEERNPAVGVGAPVDPDFVPNPVPRPAPCEKGVNSIPAKTDGAESDWLTLDDWTCHGFLMRGSSFETGPYLPELPIVSGLRPDGKDLESGKPVRLAYPDRGEHLWAWRAHPDPIEGRVTIPRECLLLTTSAVTRARWSATAGAGVSEETLDYFYSTLVTWYGTTMLKSESRQRVWMAARVNWDGRVWVNDRLVWRPAREHTPDQPAVFPADLEAGLNRITVCCSGRPVEDGNNGNFGALTYKYGELVFGSFTVWVCGAGKPRTPEAVAAAREREAAADRANEAGRTARAIRGRRGDGTGHYEAGSRPPVAWDIERNVNIRWKRALPTDDAEPAITEGKLFVTTRDGELACLDAATGAELWKKKPNSPGAATTGDYPPAAVTASFGLQARMWRKVDREEVKPHAPYARSCLTPLVGKNRAWMHDPRGVVACFDHSGKQVWAQTVPVQTPRYAEGGYVKARVLPLTHPAVIGSILVAATGEGLTAFDLESGKVVWHRVSADYLGQFATMEPVDGVGAGLVLLSSGEALDAATGETLIARCAPLVPDSACEPVVRGRVAYLHAGSSAVRFRRDANGALRSRLLWHSPVDIKKRQHDMNHNNGDDANCFSRGAYPPTPVLVGDFLFEHMGEQMTISHGSQQSMRLHVFDTVTGCASAQRYALQLNSTHPVTATIAAGGLIYCADEGGRSIGDYPDFPQTARIAIVTAEEQPRRVTRDQSGLATMSPPVFDGNRMYLAGDDQVVCVGRPDALGDRYSEYELDALRETFFALEIGDWPGPRNGGKPLRVEPPPIAKPGRNVPVVTIESGKNVDRWLFAGPFSVNPKTDVFADGGGAGAARPEEGMTVAYTTAAGAQESVPFVPLDRKFILDRSRALVYGDIRLEGAPELATANGRKMMTTCYLYTVLDSPAAGCYRFDFLTRQMRDLDIFLAGRRIAGGSLVELKQGQYPVMVRAAIGTVQSHEPLYWYLRLLALTDGEREGGVAVLEPVPVARLPDSLRAPVAPMVFASLPPRMLGAWPIEGGIGGNPYEKMTGQIGALISEGVRIAAGATSAEFRTLPYGALDTINKRGPSESMQFNIVVGGYIQIGTVEGLGLSERTLFGESRSASGLFFAVLSNRRHVTVQAQCEPNVRCWLSGQECLSEWPIRLKPGFYPFLVEYRSTQRQTSPVLPVLFREVPDPALEMARWRARVRDNEHWIKRIAASGAKGAYAQDALDRLKESE